MKKLIKVLTVIALISVFGMIFTGCDTLDEMKEKHAIINEDRSAVSFQGETFVKLPEGIPYFFNDVYSNRINVTEADVPVLLSENICHTGYYDALNDILAVSTMSLYDYGANTYNSTSYSPEEHQSIYFTKQENYEKYSKLSKDDADRVGFYNVMYTYNTAILSSSASKEILDAIKSTENWSEDASYIAYENAYDIIYPLSMCNKELTLRGTINGYELVITERHEVFLASNYNGTALMLSEGTAEDITEKLYSR